MAWTRIQGNNNDNSANATTLAVTLGAAVSSGSLVVITITWGAVSSPLPTVTDDKSNSYHLVPASQYSSNFNQGVAVYYLGNVTNGPTTFTATLHSSNQNAIFVEEFSGGKAVGDPIDGNAGQEQDALPSTAADAITSGTFTTTTNGDLIFGAELSVAQFPDAVGTGFTLGIQDNASGAFLETEYKAQTTASASTAATFTQNTGFNNWLTLGAAFLGSSSPPPVIMGGMLGDVGILYPWHLIYQASAKPILPPSFTSEDQWHEPWSEPVKVKSCVTWQQFIAFVEAAPFNETVSEDRWHSPWSEPVRTRVFPTSEQNPFAFGIPPDVIAWYVPWSDPVKVRALSTALQPPFDASIPLVSTVPTFGYFNTFSDPVRGLPGLSAANQSTLAETLVPSLVTPFLSLEWLEWMAEPVRQKPGLSSSLQGFFTEVLTPAQISTFISLEWLEWMTEPVRQKIGLGAFQIPTDMPLPPNPIPNPPGPTGQFTVSGLAVHDRFPVNDVVYTYAPITRRTN